MLNEKDLVKLEERGITEEALESQRSKFKSGFQPLKLSAAATVSSGITLLTSSEVESYKESYDKSSVSAIKFVPASGAASRMFKGLFALMDLSQEAYLVDPTTIEFFERISSFACYDDLKEAFVANEFEKSLATKDRQVISTLLSDEGLSYGSLPKGLLKFHRYDDHVRTPVQEHIAEGLMYAEKNKEVNIHFTVSPEHQSRFEEHVEQVLDSMSQDININITYSTQKPYTDTVAVDLMNELFRDDDGELLFRPAGHGALLANLNQLEADLVFVKNIDNVVPDRIKQETITYKKALAGVLLDYQQRSFRLLHANDNGEDIQKEGMALLEQMGIKGSFTKAQVVEKLNRPIRVCGMVKNEGEPGGGPFWAKNGDFETLQIVESAQVDTDDEQQQSIFAKSTHFNPVDLICGLRNYKGESFDLMKYRDDETGFITEKSFQGRKLKAMELPGLWNGSMADWNTVFVEVPLITFNPVKTIMDLLKPNHQ